MNREEIFMTVERELKYDKKNNPQVHDHIVSQTSVVSLAAADLQKSSYELKYKNKSHRDVAIEIMRQNAIRIIVKAIRFLENLK